MKEERGSVAVYVFAAVIIVIIAMISITATYANKRKSQLIETKQLQNIYDGNMNEIYSNLVNEII